MVSHGSAGEASNGRSNGTPAQGRVGKLLGDRPSKDGTAQKAAQEVEGLKGFVSGRAFTDSSGCDADGMLSHSNWETAWGKELSDPYIERSIGERARPWPSSRSDRRICKRVN
jgi:hypothetical protein